MKLLQVSCRASKGLKQMCAAPEDFNFEEYQHFDTCLLNALAAPVPRAFFEQEGSLNAVPKEYPPSELPSFRMKDHGLNQVSRQCQVLSSHMPGAELLSVHNMEHISLPLEIHILHEKWDQYYRKDEYFKNLWGRLKQEKHVQHNDHWYFILHEGKARHQGKICVEKDIMRQVITAIHTYAHLGIDKNTQMFDRKYRVMAKKPIPGCDIKAIVQEVVKACQACQSVKHRRGIHPDPMEGYPIPDDIFSSIAGDFVSFKADPVTIRNETFDQALVLVCRLSGYVTAVPCNCKMTKEVLADLFVTRIFTQWGLPKELFSDHDKLMDSEWFEHYCKLCGVEEHMAPVYKPKANGRAENAVRLVVDSLRRILEQKCSRDRVRLLPLALWVLNDVPGPVSGYSPHRIIYGGQPVGFGDVPPAIPRDGRADAATFFKQLVKDRKMVRDKLASIHRKEAAKFLKRHPRQIFKEGEKVWVRVNCQGADRESTKLDRVWEGPHEVQQRVGSGRYRVITEKGVQKMFHTVDMKLYIGPLDRNAPPLHSYTDVEYAVDSPDSVVEEVLRHAPRGRKKLMH